VDIDYVRAVNEDKIALRTVRDVSGGGHVATSLVFFPAAPFFLFMHGKDITIPGGTEITAYTNGEIKTHQSFSLTKRLPQRRPQAPSAPKGAKLTNSDMISLA